MSTIELSVRLDVDVETAWAALADVGSHHEWMEDAVAIRFDGDQREGPGTVFFADTRIGPLRTTDRMVVTKWVENQAMSVRHEGAVTGEGTFSLEPHADGGTTMRWRERLEFPWYFGGPVGAVLARPILRFVWRRNLANFRLGVERGSIGPAG
ncbi:MAG: SRPBCC family protein [Microthrixaceae bacterium]